MKQKLGPPALEEAAIRGKRVLVVDDNVEDLMYFTAVLQRLAYEVRPCPSYTDAARQVATDIFDLVIVSQGGSAFEGRTVLARAIETNRNTPVLILTRCPTMDSYIEAMQLGAFDYLEKPLTPSELGELVRVHLRRTAPSREAERAHALAAGAAH